MALARHVLVLMCDEYFTSRIHHSCQARLDDIPNEDDVKCNHKLVAKRSNVDSKSLHITILDWYGEEEQRVRDGAVKSKNGVRMSQ